MNRTTLFTAAHCITKYAMRRLMSPYRSMGYRVLFAVVLRDLARGQSFPYEGIMVIPAAHAAAALDLDATVLVADADVAVVAAGHLANHLPSKAPVADRGAAIVRKIAAKAAALAPKVATVAISAPKGANRVLVGVGSVRVGDVLADGRKVTGLGKSWTIDDEDNCAWGAAPGVDVRVQYAYLAA